MTVQELADLHAIVASVRRIESVLEEHGKVLDIHGTRLDKIERTVDRADGALSALRWLLGLVGLSGVAAVIAVFSRSQPA